MHCFRFLRKMEIGGILMKKKHKEKAFIGHTIKKIRLDKKISQRNLAGKVGISNSYLSDIENLRAVPSLQIYIKICEALELELGYILENSDL